MPIEWSHFARSIKTLSLHGLCATRVHSSLVGVFTTWNTFPYLSDNTLSCLGWTAKTHYVYIYAVSEYVCVCVCFIQTEQFLHLVHNKALTVHLLKGWTISTCYAPKPQRNNNFTINKTVLTAWYNIITASVKCMNKTLFWMC